jgi:hypothetical protein
LTLSLGGSGGGVRRGGSHRARKFGQVPLPRTSRNSPGASGWLIQIRCRQQPPGVTTEGAMRSQRAQAQEQQVRPFDRAAAGHDIRQSLSTSCLLSSVFRPLSSALCLPFSVLCLRPRALRRPSSVFCPLPSALRPLGCGFRPLWLTLSRVPWPMSPPAFLNGRFEMGDPAAGVPEGRFCEPQNTCVPLPWGRVARIVPEFCAREDSEIDASVCWARNKKNLAFGVFYLLNCCRNVVVSYLRSRKCKSGEFRGRSTYLSLALLWLPCYWREVCWEYRVYAGLSRLKAVLQTRR